MQSNLERQLYGETFMTFTPSDVNLTGSATVAVIFMAPFTGYITEISYGYGAEAGTTPAITAFTLERSTTALATLASAGTAGTLVTSGEIAVWMSRGETLNIKMTAANTDNTFLGLTIVVRCRRPLSTD